MPAASQGHGVRRWRRSGVTSSARVSCQAEEEHGQLGQERPSRRPARTAATGVECRGEAFATRTRLAERPPELIEHIHGKDRPGCHVVHAEQGCHASDELRGNASTQFARHQAGDDDDQGAGERRDDVDRHEAVAGNDAQQRREPAHQRRLDRRSRPGGACRRRCSTARHESSRSCPRRACGPRKTHPRALPATRQPFPCCPSE